MLYCAFSCHFKIYCLHCYSFAAFLAVWFDALLLLLASCVLLRLLFFCCYSFTDFTVVTVCFIQCYILLLTEDATLLVAVAANYYSLCLLHACSWFCSSFQASLLSHTQPNNYVRYLLNSQPWNLLNFCPSCAFQHNDIALQAMHEMLQPPPPPPSPSHLSDTH